MVRVSYRVIARGFVTLVLLYLYAPIVVIVLFSLTTSPRLSIPIEGLTLAWYASALSDPLMETALRNSLVLALIASLSADVLDTAFAYGLVKLQGRRRLRSALIVGGLLPAVVPLLVIGIALAVFFRFLGSPQGLANAAVGHVLVSLPSVILTMNARLETFDFSTLEAARDLPHTRICSPSSSSTLPRSPTTSNRSGGVLTVG
jgi:spermidine/putrescine transport system permease protein